LGGGDAEVAPRGLERGPRRGPFLARDPGDALEVAQRRLRSCDGRRRDDRNVVLNEGLALEVSRGGEPSDDRELRPVCANELDHGLRRADLNIELDARMSGMERGDRIDRQVHPGARSRDRKSSGLGARERPRPPCRLRDKSFGPLDMVRHELARRGEADPPRASDHELCSELGLELRDVLRHGRLADDELLRGGRERTSARQGGERP